MAIAACLDIATIISQGGQVINNLDGSVSVYRLDQNNVLAPVILTKQCCSILDSSYTWDANTQTCKYQSTPTCDIENVFKIILNPQGNDGTIFDFGSNKDCVLDVSFDYLLKIKCETLNSLLINGANSEYSDVNPQLALQITNLQISIEDQTIQLETLTSEINLLQEQYQLTSYSIVCDSSTTDVDVVDVVDLPKGRLNSFGKTGFNLSPDITTTTTTTNKASKVNSGPTPNGGKSVTYCIQEPEGLIAWGNILGVTNYNNFVNGDPNSYTCANIDTLISLNTNAISNGNAPLIVECNTPFGTKTEIYNELESLLALQASYQTNLDELTSQLVVLQETLNTELSNSCIRPIDMFESLDLSMTVDVLSGTTYETVYEATDFFPSIGYGLLYNYLTNNQNSGFYVCGGSDCTPMYLNVQGIPQTNTITCDAVVESLLDSLFTESNLSGTTDGNTTFSSSLSNSAFTSTWLNYQTTIEDQSILSAFTDNKIRISIKINHTCADICILLDNIQLNKVCTSVKETNIFVTSSPGFELDRIRDNKKSWLKNTSLVNRDFEILNAKSVNPIRQTNYNVEDERLVINTKEIDLDISLASAIVTDVWCYISDNQCLLTGDTYCDPCAQPYNGAPYELITSDGTCYIIESENATSYGTFLTAYTGSKSTGYDQNGASFYKSDLTGNLPYTLYTTGISDSLNVSITPDAVSNVNLWDSNGSTANGRLNNCGIWPNVVTNFEWIGFSKCINIPTTGVYSIGIAGDNRIRFKVNGKLFYNGNLPIVSSFNTWRVFEVTLSAGINAIELEGYNDGGLASFGAEIYQADIVTLSAMTTTTQLDAVTVFTTKDFRYETNGNIPVEFDLGESSGYSCPAGYFLNTCSEPFTCSILVEASCSVICCGDNEIQFDNLLTQPLSAITVVEDFEYYLTSELIDVKNRQTISGYPTLRALYDRYMSSYQYCGINSSEFDYMNMDQFAGLVGDYWVDIIEQVVPSTTIWGSVKIYSNTIFDQQKFRYKSYTSLLCNNPFNGILVPSPISATTGQYQIVDVNTVTLNLPTTANTNVTTSNSTNCDRIYIAQMNSGSEFIGTVNMLGEEKNCDESSVINECTLQVEVTVDGLVATAVLIGAEYPVTYDWDNGQTESVAIYDAPGFYTLTVTDSSCCSVLVKFEMSYEACWYTLPDTVEWIQNGFDTWSITDYVYTMNSMIVNGVEIINGVPPSYTLTQANFDPISTPNGFSYTNFVTFLNQAFASLGLINYKAQLSITNDLKPTTNPSNILGFYIVRPKGDTFYMYISETNNFDSIYTNNDASNGNNPYSDHVCNNTIVINNDGVVIE
jgi:hypothetical protein